MNPESADNVILGLFSFENPVPECNLIPWDGSGPSYTWTESFGSTSKSLNWKKLLIFYKIRWKYLKNENFD